MNIAEYPTWNSLNRKRWNANGDYTPMELLIENYADYQNYYYSFSVFYYQMEGRFKKLRSQKNIDHVKVEDDNIPTLDFSNTNKEDLAASYTITVVDMTSYIDNQPPLKLYCTSDNESIVEIEFNNENSSDITQREFTFPLKPFTTIRFTFDIKTMKPL